MTISNIPLGLVFCYGAVILVFAKPLEKWFPLKRIKDGYGVLVRRVNGVFFLIVSAALLRCEELEQVGKRGSREVWFLILAVIFLCIGYAVIMRRFLKE